MTLRLIEIVLPKSDGENVRKLLKDHEMLEYREIQLSADEIMVRILLEAEDAESILDSIESKYDLEKSKRVVILPVQAILPKEEPKTADLQVDEIANGKKPDRIAKEELYEQIKDVSKCSQVYLVMVALSTIVAIVGLHRNSVEIIIGAMVIAPLLGPNMALALGTTLGDLSLLRHAMITLIAGILAVVVISTFIGIFVNLDPAEAQIAVRTSYGLGDIAVALASGCAGALAFTTGVAATMIGVMVAVALLPPLVTFGLLLGNGDLTLAFGALSLFIMNLICVNLAGVTTFFIQGILPTTWWEKDRAVKATWIAICLYLGLFAGLVGIIYWF